MASDRDWVIVRPGVLKNGPARANYQHGPDAGNYLWPVVFRERMSLTSCSRNYATTCTWEWRLGRARFVGGPTPMPGPRLTG